MAAESEKGRAGLPFEPGRKKKKTAGEGATPVKANTQKKENQKQEKKTAKVSDVSARAQARADEILAGNRRKKEKAQNKGEGANSQNGKQRGRQSDSGAIPKDVSQRMLRRMAILSGSPVFLGVGLFFLSYYLKSREIVDLPPVAVLLVTMGCFGLGVLGLTYGVLSASWDSEPGSLVGLSEFKLNFGRVMEARRASKT
ncbi:MAG: PAM68 family protein [Cyanobacteria bacterium P01_D01_bin.105]